MKTLKVLTLSCILLLAFGCSKENIETENIAETEVTVLETRGGGPDGVYNGTPTTILVVWKVGLPEHKKQGFRDSYTPLISWAPCPSSGMGIGRDREVWTVYTCASCIPLVADPAEEDDDDVERTVIEGDCSSL